MMVAGWERVCRRAYDIYCQSGGSDIEYGEFKKAVVSFFKHAIVSIRSGSFFSIRMKYIGVFSPNYKTIVCKWKEYCTRILNDTATPWDFTNYGIITRFLRDNEHVQKKYLPQGIDDDGEVHQTYLKRLEDAEVASIE